MRRLFYIINNRLNFKPSLEILGLKWLDIDANANQIVIRKSKSGRMRFIPLHPDVAEVLGSLPKHGKFFSDKQGQELEKGPDGYTMVTLTKMASDVNLRKIAVLDEKHPDTSRQDRTRNPLKLV